MALIRWPTRANGKTNPTVKLSKRKMRQSQKRPAHTRCKLQNTCKRETRCKLQNACKRETRCKLQNTCTKETRCKLQNTCKRGLWSSHNPSPTPHPYPSGLAKIRCVFSELAARLSLACVLKFAARFSLILKFASRVLQSFLLLPHFSSRSHYKTRPYKTRPLQNTPPS